MSLYFYVAVVAVVGLVILAAVTVYCNIRNMNVTIEKNDGVLHFYDLATTPYYEGNEQSQSAMDDLLAYLHEKSMGQRSRLSEAARDRYIPVTKKSTTVLSLLAVWEVSKTVFCILFLFASIFAVLIVAGTPL